MAEDYVKPIRIARIGGEFVFVPHNDVVESMQMALRNSSTSKPTETSYGLRSAQLQTIFDNFYASTISSYSHPIQMYFAYRFLALDSLEEKRVGTMIIMKNLDELTVDFVDDFERVFDSNINEWTTCDAFALRVIGPLIKKSDEFAHRIITWKDSNKVWRMRAAAVAFVVLAKVGAMKEQCFDICSACIKSSERFVQLGVGCLLRDLSLMSPDDVVAFITQHYRFFSREGLRYSIDKLPTPTRKQILALGKKKSGKQPAVVADTKAKPVTPPVPQHPMPVATPGIPVAAIHGYAYQPVYFMGGYDGSTVYGAVSLDGVGSELPGPAAGGGAMGANSQ